MKRLCALSDALTWTRSIVRAPPPSATVTCFPATVVPAGPVNVQFVFSVSSMRLARSSGAPSPLVVAPFALDAQFVGIAMLSVTFWPAVNVRVSLTAP